MFLVLQTGQFHMKNIGITLSKFDIEETTRERIKTVCLSYNIMTMKIHVIKKGNSQPQELDFLIWINESYGKMKENQPGNNVQLKTNTKLIYKARTAL